jgi:mono/diheme cytochrome c family protein
VLRIGAHCRNRAADRALPDRIDALYRTRRMATVTRRHKFLFAAAGASVLVLAGVVVGFVILLSGSLSTAATTQHFALTYRILDAGLRFSIRANARGIVAPPLDDPAMIQRGSSCYRAHCVQCHGSPADSRHDYGKGLLPTPGNLAESAREWPPAWLYYVTKKGVRMTGMPAWEFRLSEESLWATVAFMKRLPFLTEQQYRGIEASANDAPCARDTDSPPVTSSRRGKIVLRQYACDSCHRIEGVVGPQTYVGPALVDWPRRKYIAGVLPNTRENLVRWISDPEAVSPGTLMPDLGVPRAHAHEMATYLLERE